ncbi:MAG: hypothetical protein ACHQRM_15290 [Bacteroidia bacterium]
MMKNKSGYIVLSFLAVCLLYLMPLKGYTQARSIKSPVRFYLVSCKDSTRKIGLKESGEISMDLTEKFDTTVLKSRNDHTSGRIFGLTDTTLKWKMYSENSILRYKDGNSLSTEHYFGFSQDSLGLARKEIPLRQINTLYYTSHTRSIKNGIGGTVMACSFLSLFLVAPLASINYHTGSFNASRYYTWAGSSLAGVALSIPLVAFADKRYKIVPNHTSKTPGTWYLMEDKYAWLKQAIPVKGQK